MLWSLSSIFKIIGIAQDASGLPKGQVSDSDYLCAKGLTIPCSGPQEALEACQTRISKMELQQQQQQVVQLEGLENATARNLLGKLINILLAVMAVLLVFVSTVANCVVPLMKTRNRTFSTLFLVVFIAFLWKHWDALFSYVERFFSSPRWCWQKKAVLPYPLASACSKELDSNLPTLKFSTTTEELSESVYI